MDRKIARGKKIFCFSSKIWNPTLFPVISFKAVSALKFPLQTTFLAPWLQNSGFISTCNSQELTSLKRVLMHLCSTCLLTLHRALNTNLWGRGQFVHYYCPIKLQQQRHDFRPAALLRLSEASQQIWERGQISLSLVPLYKEMYFRTRLRNRKQSSPWASSY